MEWEWWNLKTVDQHNTEKRQARKEREEAAKRTGVACPNCGKELVWWRIGVGFSYPAQTTQPGHCSSCGLTVDLET